MQAITPEQQQLLQNTLLSDFADLKEKVKARLMISSKQHLNALVEKVDDMNADMLLDSLVNSESHSLNLYKQQIKSLDAALQGMELGIYGFCSDCETELDCEVLFKNPTTQRCPDCEIKYQRQNAKGFKL